MDNMTRPQSGIDRTADNSGCSSARRNIEDGSINLADYLLVILKYRRMIFWICAVTIITTGIVCLFLPRSYAATTSVVPPIDVLQKGGGMAGGLGAAKSPLLAKMMDVTSVADMYVGILQSRSVVDALIERFDLATAYNVKKGFTAVRRILQQRTSIKVTDEGIVQITVEDRDPCQAAALANAYVEELDRQNKRLFVGQAVSKKVFLENRLKEIEQELSRIDNLLSRDAKIKEMLFELLTREYEIAKIEEAKSMPTIQVLDKAIVPEVRMPRGIKSKLMLAAAISFVAAFFAAFFKESLQKKELKESGNN